MRLSDFFIPILAYIKSFAPTSVTTAQNVSDKVIALVEQAQGEALNSGFPVESFQNALFPVVAWADEHLSTSKAWKHGNTWQQFLLQRRYFQTSLAGKEFFDRLKGLEPLDTDVRELYVLCLCFGFVGKHRLDPNSSSLKALCLDEYKKLIFNSGAFSLGEHFKMFPSAYSRKDKFRNNQYGGLRYWLNPLTIVLIVVPPLIVLFLLVSSVTELSHMTDQFVKSIKS